MVQAPARSRRRPGALEKHRHRLEQRRQYQRLRRWSWKATSAWSFSWAGPADQGPAGLLHGLGDRPAQLGPCRRRPRAGRGRSMILGPASLVCGPAPLAAPRGKLFLLRPLQHRQCPAIEQAVCLLQQLQPNQRLRENMAASIVRESLSIAAGAYFSALRGSSTASESRTHQILSRGGESRLRPWQACGRRPTQSRSGRQVWDDHSNFQQMAA